MMKVVIFALLVVCALATIPGGWYEVEVDSEEVVKAAGEANKALGKKFNTPYHTKLHKVQKAKQQVVAGKKYDLTVIVGLTNCKKEEVDYNDIETCEFQDGVSTYRKCDVIIYRNLKDVYELIWSGCILTKP